MNRSNNLNQVAIPAHTYGVYPEEIDRLKRDYAKLWGEVSKALRELSERELSLARLMAGRRTNREIAEALYLSEGTVKQYINRIYSKLQLTGSAQEKRRALIALFEKY